MNNYWVRRNQLRRLLREAELLIEVYGQNGLNPHEIDFSALFAKYPRVQISARRLLDFIKQKHGVF